MREDFIPGMGLTRKRQKPTERSWLRGTDHDDCSAGSEGVINAAEKTENVCLP